MAEVDSIAIEALVRFGDGKEKNVDHQWSFIGDDSRIDAHLGSGIRAAFRHGAKEVLIHKPGADLVSALTMKHLHPVIEASLQLSKAVAVLEICTSVYRDRPGDKEKMKLNIELERTRALRRTFDEACSRAGIAERLTGRDRDHIAE